MQEKWVQSLGWEDFLEEEVATPLVFSLDNPMDRGSLGSTVMGSQGGHDWVTEQVRVYLKVTAGTTSKEGHLVLWPEGISLLHPVFWKTLVAWGVVFHILLPNCLWKLIWHFHLNDILAADYDGVLGAQFCKESLAMVSHGQSFIKLEGWLVTFFSHFCFCKCLNDEAISNSVWRCWDPN